MPEDINHLAYALQEALHDHLLPALDQVRDYALSASICSLASVASHGYVLSNF